MATTNHLSIALLEQSQAQKEVTANEAFGLIDAVLNTGAIDLFLTTPPVSPSAGDLYIVPTSATGDWAGHDNEITYFDQIWRFITPNTGMTLWVQSQAQNFVYDGFGWINVNSFGIRIRSGVNERLGSAILVAGTVTVANNNVFAGTHIFLTTEGTSTGAIRVSTRNSGVDFTITSSDVASTDTVHWMLVEPA